MQKNPINEGDSIQEPMTLQDYEDAVSLPDGIYPITDDAGTVLDASVIAYGNRTVEDVLNEIDNDVTVTPLSPNSLAQSSVTKVGNLVGGNLRFGATASANTETQIATIDKKPTDTIYCDAFKTGDYTKGIAIIHTNGKINVQFPSALSGTGIAFSFAYKTND